MKILSVGNGGREHSIAWKISTSDSFINSNGKLYCTLGNPGINNIASPININPSDTQNIIKFVNDEQINLVVIGPEIPLSLGLTDSLLRFTKAKVFGPTKRAAEIETSKIFAKDFMVKYRIPSAQFKSFGKSNYNEIEPYLNKIAYPAVIKADGLAAGKGVYIAVDKNDALVFINDITSNKIFGESGASFIIEDFLEGFELSLFVITDGNNYKILPTAQDHKKIGDGDNGKNTGGMGAYSPADRLINETVFDKIKSEIIEPSLKGLQIENRTFVGCLYCGLMIVNKNNFMQPYVIEYNCRFGDPETQAVLPLIKSDFLQLLIAASEGNVQNYKLETYNKFAACVVAASKGYPDAFEKGKEINGLENIDNDTLIFHSGTVSEDNLIKTNGGRVLSVVSVSDKSMDDCLDKCYDNIARISFDNIYYRKDIGKKFAQLLKLKL